MNQEEFCTLYSEEQFNSFLSRFSCGDNWTIVVSPCGTLSIRWDVTFERLKELCKQYSETLWIKTEYQSEFAFDFKTTKATTVCRRSLLETYLTLYPEHLIYIQDRYPNQQWINPDAFSEKEFEAVFKNYDNNLEWTVSHQIPRD